MIIASTEVVKEIIKRLIPLNLPVFSVIPPANVLRYIYVTDTAETDISTKSGKISQGFLQISITEKFPGDDGTMAWVDDTARQVINAIQPTVNGEFGLLNGLTIFAINVEDNTSQLAQTDTGRVAVRSLRLKFNAY
jgi:hypothetical protein